MEGIERRTATPIGIDRVVQRRCQDGKTASLIFGFKVFSSFGVARTSTPFSVPLGATGASLEPSFQSCHVQGNLGPGVGARSRVRERGSWGKIGLLTQWLGFPSVRHPPWSVRRRCSRPENRVFRTFHKLGSQPASQTDKQTDIQVSSPNATPSVRPSRKSGALNFLISIRLLLPFNLMRT